MRDRPLFPSTGPPLFVYGFQIGNLEYSISINWLNWRVVKIFTLSSTAFVHFFYQNGFQVFILISYSKSILLPGISNQAFCTFRLHFLDFRSFDLHFQIQPEMNALDTFLFYLAYMYRY